MYNYYQSKMLKGYPVGSLDEARAAPIEFDGSVSYYPDLVNNKIYTKQFNIDGTMKLQMYELKEIPVEAPKDYISREEFTKAIEELKNLQASKNF